MRRIAVVVLMSFFTFLSPADRALAADAAGSADHPVVPRYEGSFIVHYAHRDVDSYLLPEGKLKDGMPLRPLRLEGKVTRIRYACPENRATLEILKHFETALVRQGFEVVFTGGGEVLGGIAGWPDTFYHQVYELYGDPKHQYALAAKRSDTVTDTYANLYVSLGWRSHAYVQLDVIETKAAPPDGKGKKKPARKTDAAELERALYKEGRAVVPGIAFGRDAVLAGESDAAVRAVAGILNKDADLKLLVVAHTDNAASYPESVEQSRSRAESLVRELTGVHGIAPDRLRAVGAGPVSPIVSNRTPAGRGKNNRIELVIH